MIIECPSCKYTADVDPAKVPPEGKNAKCPKCSHGFVLEKDVHGIVHIQQDTVQQDAPADGNAAIHEAPMVADPAHHPELEILSGPAATAVKMEGSRLWTVVPEGDMAGKGRSLGLMLLIAKDDKERAGDPATTKSIVNLGLSSTRQSVPIWLPSLISLFAILIFAAGHLSGYGHTILFKDTVFVSWADLLLAMVTAVVTTSGLTMCEAAALGRHLAIQGTSSFWGFRSGFLRIEPVVWRLGIPVRVAFYTISLAFFLIYFALGWFLLSPPILSGVVTGACLYLVIALYPLEPGPGSNCLEALTGSPDIPKQLQWTILSRFLALRLSSQASSGMGMAVASVFLVLWAASAGGVFYFLTSDLFSHGSIAGVVWRTFFSLFGLCYTVWLVFRIVRMISTASRLRLKARLLPVKPSEEILAFLRLSSAINCHIPDLQNALWQWVTAPAGSFLIRRGAEDSNFFWIASGKAAVFARDKNNAPLQVASLGPGTGVGEIALLENVRRTADVVIEQTAVVAMLDQATFMKYTDEDDRVRFRQVVMAGQALSRSQVFSSLPGSDRELWIAGGRPKFHGNDEIIISEGSGEKWIALIVSGRLEVLKEGMHVAELGPDAVIGEMAYLEDKPRTATLRAQDSVLLWQWEPEWLDTHLDRSDLLAALTELARERGRA